MKRACDGYLARGFTVTRIEEYEAMIP